MKLKRNTQVKQYINSNYIIDTSNRRRFVYSFKDTIIVDGLGAPFNSKGFVAKNQRFSNMQNVFEKETLYREEYSIISMSIWLLWILELPIVQTIENKL